jgi:gluconolactonase
VKLSPEGEQLDEIAFPKASGVTNLCFGGPEMKTLYVTLAGGQRKVVALEVDEPGLALVGQKK